MAKKEVENPNEIEFSKTKGFSYINYCTNSAKATVGDTELAVEKSSKWFYIIKGKKETVSIEYGTIENVEIKTHFAIGDLVFGLFFGILWPITGEAGFLILTAVFLFCAYGKNIIITRKDGTKVVMMSEGLGQGEEIEKFCKKLDEKGVAVQRGKK